MGAEREQVLESLGPARKFADPASPASVRMLAASGALPLAPAQIAVVLYALLGDDDGAVRERAAQSLAHLPERVLEAALGAQVPGGLLAHLAELHRERPERLEQIALNPHTSDETFCFLASLPHPALIDIVSHNQTRLLRCEALVEALGNNPATGAATLDRVLEFLGIGRRSDEESAPPPPAVPEPAAGTEAAAKPGEAQGAQLFDPEAFDDIPPELLEDAPPEGEDDSETRGVSLAARISKMTVMQKIRVARFGNAEARSILARDRNKLVCSAAVKSPKIAESEILAFCKNRAIPEEVLRIISSSREWTKSRTIQAALCVHPKTPVPIAMKFLNNLTDLELKHIMKSKDVPGPIAVHARRLLVKKGKV